MLRKTYKFIVSMLKRLIFAKPMRGIVQVSELSNLPLELMRVLTKLIEVLLVFVDGGEPVKVSVFANAFLHVSHFFIQKAQHQSRGVSVLLVRYYVMRHTTSVVNSFASDRRRHPWIVAN